MVGVENYPGKEGLLNIRASTFIIAPPTDEPIFYKDYNNFDPQAAHKQLSVNMDIVNGANVSMLHEENRTQFARIREFLNYTWNRYKEKLEEIKTAPDGLWSIFDFLDKQNIPYYPEGAIDLANKLPMEKMSRYFSHCFSQASGPTVALSESHGTTVPMIEAIKGQNPNAKIGFFVFDTHVDTQIGPSGNISRKTNVLRLLQKKRKEGRLVERIVTIGEPDELYVWQQGQGSDPEKYSGRIKVVTEEDLYGNDPHQLSFSNKTLNQIIDREIQIFAKRGITNLMTTLDIDIFKSGFFDYTAMEYSPLHALFFLSSIDLRGYKENPQHIFWALTKEECGMGVTVLTEPVVLGGRGLSTLYLQNAYQQIQKSCKKYSIQYGIQFENALVVGDIVELCGPDYQNLTKKAILEVAKSMYPEVV